MKKQFVDDVYEALATTSVRDNLGKNEAVVLERLARGGGATNWYYCKNEQVLGEIVERLRPGSVVSFYFDGRICKLRDLEEVRLRVEEVVAAVGECVVGALSTDGVTVEVDLVSGLDDLSGFVNGLSSPGLFFAGEFPARDNNGKHAVTITLPDLDGEVRQHPH